MEENTEKLDIISLDKTRLRKSKFCRFFVAIFSKSQYFHNLSIISVDWKMSTLCQHYFNQTTLSAICSLWVSFHRSITTTSSLILSLVEVSLFLCLKSLSSPRTIFLLFTEKISLILLKWSFISFWANDLLLLTLRLF